MFCEYKKFDLGNGYTIIEPPAGLLLEIHKRTKIYADETGKLNTNTWAAIFVLSCLYHNDVPVFAEVANTIPDKTDYNTTTIKEAYCYLPDDEFKAVIEEFTFNITRDKLQEWFDIIDVNCLITKKTTDEVKNG